MAEAKKVQRQAVKRSRCAIYTRKSSEEGLEELVFGMRCAVSVKYAVVKALEKRDRPVRLFELCEKTGSFLLQKRSLDTHELIVPLPRVAGRWTAFSRTSPRMGWTWSARRLRSCPVPQKIDADGGGHGYDQLCLALSLHPKLGRLLCIARVPRCGAQTQRRDDVV